MARVEFVRVDCAVELSAGDGGDLQIRVGRGDGSFDAPMSLGLNRDALSSAATAQPDLGKSAESWQRFARALSMRGPPGPATLRRIVLHVEDPFLATLDWEAAIDQCLESDDRPTVMRGVRVPSRESGRPLSFPIRALQIGDAAGGFDLVERWKALGSDAWGSAILAEHRDSSMLAVATKFVDWASVDILHFDDLREPLPSTAMLKQGAAEWLRRIADIHRTRLLVLRAAQPQNVSWLRSLATAVATRGGPAALVIDARLDGLLPAFYDWILQDFPLDAAFASLPAPSQAPGLTLIAGAGREDLLRASTIGEELRQYLRPDDGFETTYAFNPAQGGSAADQIQAPLRRLEDELPTYDFPFSASDGIVPMSKRVRDVQRALDQALARTAPSPSEGGAPRQVYPSLSTCSSGGTSNALPPSGSTLNLGQTYLLEIAIQPRDPKRAQKADLPLFEDAFAWSEHDLGTWIEIGISGLDFDVIGNPVQEVWLPRTGAADTVRFAVSPRRAGASRLRYCIYYQNDLLQSFRLVAAVSARGESPPAPADARRAIAEALDLPDSDAIDDGYHARLEYSTVKTLDPSTRRSPTTLSLVANHIGDERVVTFKGAGAFGVRVNRDLPARVQQVRDALLAASFRAVGEGAEATTLYAYSQGNVGKVETLGAALRTMAIAGWDLYNAIFKKQDRDALQPILEEPDAKIQVAHVLLEDVVPWAAIYDQHYDDGCTHDDDGTTVDRDVCLASLPREAGGSDVTSCGGPGCLLHPDSITVRCGAGGRKVIPRTVVCPRHFWGFKHRIEIPAQQVGEDGGSLDLADQIDADQPAKLIAALNPSVAADEVGDRKSHREELDTILGGATAPRGAWIDKLDRRDSVLRALQRADLDVIYFYCHAFGGAEADPPVLEIAVTANVAEGRIKPADLDGPAWAHHPLVFLNACETAGFRPDSLSPFITTLVQDRGAAGVIGTEVRVTPPLAREMALLFLAEFLDGRSAGDALQTARHALLAKRNPLGLIYTLYASADLRLERKA